MHYVTLTIGEKFRNFMELYRLLLRRSSTSIKHKIIITSVNTK